MESKNATARLVQAEKEYLLYPNHSYRLGRSAESDIVLDDPKVSRAHAVLEWNGSGFTLRDLDSSNGSFINDQRVSNTPHLLRDGDRVLLGKHLILTYEIIRAEPAQPMGISPANGAEKTIIGGYEPQASQVSGPNLVVSGGPDMGKVFPLFGEHSTIGRDSRDATWEIRLTDRSVSRPHARLERAENGFYLNDLESANGTQVNGAAVNSPVLLKEGDVIALGETRLIFHMR